MRVGEMMTFRYQGGKLCLDISLQTANLLAETTLIMQYVDRGQSKMLIYKEFFHLEIFFSGGLIAF